MAESISFAPLFQHLRSDAEGMQEYADIPQIMMGGRNETANIARSQHFRFRNGRFPSSDPDSAREGRTHRTVASARRYRVNIHVDPARPARTSRRRSGGGV